MGFLTRCKRPFLFAFLLQFCNMLFSFFLKTFLILFEKQHQVLVEVTPDVTGRVRLDGVDWNARSEQTIPAGSLCVVLSVDGATLTVRPDTATAAV